MDFNNLSEELQQEFCETICKVTRKTFRNSGKRQRHLKSFRTHGKNVDQYLASFLQERTQADSNRQEAADNVSLTLDPEFGFEADGLTAQVGLTTAPNNPEASPFNQMILTPRTLPFDAASGKVELLQLLWRGHVVSYFYSFVYFFKSREIIRDVVRHFNEKRDASKFEPIRLDHVDSMLENACSVIRCDNHFTAHMGTILMMAITRYYSQMLFYGRKNSPYLEELQDGFKYQSGFFVGKSFFSSNQWWYLDDIVEHNNQKFRIVEISECWVGDGKYKIMCYLRRNGDEEIIMSETSSSTWQYSLSSERPSKYRLKTGGIMPYHTLSIVLFTDDLGIEVRKNRPAESISMTLGNLPK